MPFHLLRLSLNPLLPLCVPISSGSRSFLVVGRRDEHNQIFNERILSLDLRSASKESVASISPRHARIVIRGAGDDTVVKVFDDSLTGVYLNDVRIEFEAALMEGVTQIFSVTEGNSVVD